VSLDYKCDTGHYLEMRIQPGGGGNDYNPATGAYDQAAPFWFPVHAYAGHVASRTRGRFFLRPTPTTASQTITVHVRLPGSHGNGATAHVYHLEVSFDGGTYNTRTPRDAAITAVRSENYVRFSDAGSQIWPNERGTIIVDMIALFDSDEVTASLSTVAQVRYAESAIETSEDHMYGIGFTDNGGVDSAFFKVRASGSGTQVFSYAALPAFAWGQALRLAARWCSPTTGDLGLPVNTCNVFVKLQPVFSRTGALVLPGGSMVKGTSVVRSLPTRDTADLILRPPVFSGGYLIREITVFPWCLTDDEIANRA
jgi:hypothetical protein